MGAGRGVATGAGRGVARGTGAAVRTGAGLGLGRGRGVGVGAGLRVAARVGAGVTVGEAVGIAAGAGTGDSGSGAPNRATPPGTMSGSRTPLVGRPGNTGAFRTLPSTCPAGGPWRRPACTGASSGMAGGDIRVMLSAPTTASCRGDAASRRPANARRAERTPSWADERPRRTEAAPRWMDVLPRRCEASSRRAGASPICHDAVPRREGVVAVSLPASREASKTCSSDGRIRCGRVAFLPSGHRAARLVGGSRAGPGAAGAMRGGVLRKPIGRDDVPGASQTRRCSPFDPGRNLRRSVPADVWRQARGLRMVHANDVARAHDEAASGERMPLPGRVARGYGRSARNRDRMDGGVN